MTKSTSIIQYFKHRIPQKYRLITFLVATSIIGVLLIFLAVYNTSKDLELIHAVDNLHRFAKVSLAGNVQQGALVKTLTNDPAADYQFIVLENNNVIHHSHESAHIRFPLDLSNLEQSRINERGGYVKVEDKIYTWAQLPIAGDNKYVVLTHRFAGSSPVNLVSVYLKRLFVPAIFYIWLMVWVGLIIRFLTDKLISQNKELERMALYDSLTGLPNRVLLNDRLHKLIQACQRNQCAFALAVIDLNKFKSVNDTYGHDQGDELLCQVADRVREILRTSDTFSRIGGDEFVLLLNDVNARSCLHMCERIQNVILNPYVLREGTVSIGLSIGIAMYPEHARDSESLMRYADMAMYTIKTKGGGIRIYNDEQGEMNNIITGVSSN